MNLTGRVAVVTGAGAGIGQAVALAFSAAGAHLVVNDVSVAAANATVREIEAGAGKAVAVAGAVGDEQTATRLVQAATEVFGDLDIVVNCAGITRDRMIHNMSLNEFDEVIGVHLRGTWLNCREAIRYWRPIAKIEAQERPDPATRRYRKIVNVTSMSGLRGILPGQTNYAAAKAGIVGLTKTLAREVGPLAINVNAVAPMATTAMTRENDLGLRFPEGPERDAFLDSRIERSALRWIGLPDAVTDTFVFLASRGSDYITGQILNADGGANI